MHDEIAQPAGPGVMPEAVAEADAASREAVRLFKPIYIDGREIKELTLDFDNLTGETIQKVEAEMTAAKTVALGGAALSQTYNMYVAARAAGVTIHDIRRLSIRDATRVVRVCPKITASTIYCFSVLLYSSILHGICQG